MPITPPAANLSAQGFHVKKLYTPAGAETLSNADIVSGMIAGPLRDLWTATYASQALAEQALSTIHGTIRLTMMAQVATADGVGLRVNVDGGQLPVIDVTTANNGGGMFGVLELMVRHSIVR